MQPDSKLGALARIVEWARKHASIPKMILPDVLWLVTLIGTELSRPWVTLKISSKSLWLLHSAFQTYFTSFKLWHRELRMTLIMINHSIVSKISPSTISHDFSWSFILLLLRTFSPFSLESSLSRSRFALKPIKFKCQCSSVAKASVEC